jgi:hypothetical protein
VNNCSTANGGCDANATCTYTGPGTNSCACNSGYSGDGTTCSAATSANLNTGAYTGDEVWDCQRNPAFPVANSPFTASWLDTPYSDADGTQVFITAGQTVRFDYVGGACSDPPDMTETLYDSGNNVVAVLSTSGGIWGLGAEGFLYISTMNGFGTFIANGEHLTSGGSLTYTPTTAQASCADLVAYQAAH